MQRLAALSQNAALVASALHCARSRENFGVGTASRLTTSGTGTQPPRPAAAHSIMSMKAGTRMASPRPVAIIRQGAPRRNRSALRRPHPYIDGAHALALRQD